jgi:tRNA dimethylallyltransferase
VFVLERPTAELDRRIAARTEVMLAAGWIAETEEALVRHRADGPGLVSIGYREIVRHLQGELAQKELAPAIVRATRQYAKRQRTWFRGFEPAWRGHPDEPGLAATLAGYLSAP